jgi:hypothetical protein
MYIFSCSGIVAILLEDNHIELLAESSKPHETVQLHRHQEGEKAAALLAWPFT